MRALKSRAEAKSATYAGVTPLGRKSGKSLDTSHLTQGVNKRILHALYTSSVVAVKHSAIDRAYYTKKLREYAGHPKPHVAAFIALSRQRHKVVYKLMTTAARYSSEILISRHLDRIDGARKAGRKRKHPDAGLPDGGLHLREVRGLGRAARDVEVEVRQVACGKRDGAD